MTDASDDRPHPMLLAVAVVAVALNLRPAIASVPPVLDTIEADLGLSGAAAGVLTALPVICMGLFAPVGALAAARLGLRRAVAASLVLVAVGTLARGAGGAGAIYGGIAVAGVGIAVAGALLPAVVKAYFGDKVGLVTGLYTCALAAGALLAAMLTAPLVGPLDGWARALAVWALLGVAGLAFWLPVTGTLPGPTGRNGRARTGWLWRNRTAWLATGFMGGQSLLYYASLTWLSPRFTDEGWSSERAGVLLGVFSGTQLISSLGVPALAARGDRRRWIAGCLATTAVCFLLVGFAPLTAPWPVAAVLGLVVGGQFGLALTLLAETAATPVVAAGLSGMAFGVGYLLAAAGPVAAGALRDASGGYQVPYLVLAVLAVPVALCGVAIRPGVTVGDHDP